MTLADYIIIAVVAVCVIAALYFIFRRKKGGCGGDCSHCGKHCG